MQILEYKCHDMIAREGMSQIVREGCLVKGREKGLLDISSSWHRNSKYWPGLKSFRIKRASFIQ